MLFDTHAHLTDKKYAGEIDTLINELPANDIGLVLNPGCNLPDSLAAVKLANSHECIYAAVGIHPHDAEPTLPSAYPALEVLCEEPKVLAIGEIGLDYHYDYSPRDIQQKVFARQLELAQSLDLPVIIHDRDAHEDCLRILGGFPHLRAVFHCYSGSLEMALELVRRGYYLSFTGAITFPNARKAVEVVREIPGDRILTETDAPYLTPVPYRGKRNEPKHVRYVAEAMANIRETTYEEISALTMKNAKEFFRLKG